MIHYKVQCIFYIEFYILNGVHIMRHIYGAALVYKVSMSEVRQDSLTEIRQDSLSSEST